MYVCECVGTYMLNANNGYAYTDVQQVYLIRFKFTVLVLFDFLISITNSHSFPLFCRYLVVNKNVGHMLIILNDGAEGSSTLI